MEVSLSKWNYQTSKIPPKNAFYYTWVVVIILPKKWILLHCALDCDGCCICLITQNAK